MPDSITTPYADVSPHPDFPAIECRILERWSKNNTFARSIEQRSQSNEFVFYDGPPFANGLPHHGHLLTGYVKDVIPRYKTMRGKRVDRRFGWDCHGLPAEMEAEKQLGVSGRSEIEEYGIARFNAHCRESVMQYTSEWKETVNRQARWVDFENDYKTMDLSYMESVMWAFKQLYEKDLIYESYRVMPYSWGAETPLSNFEIRLDDATRPRQDPAVTIGLDLIPQNGDPGPLRILAWTTTPWTLPSNLALAVGPDVEYAIVAHEDHNYVIAADALSNYEAQLGSSEVVGTLEGSDLVGRRYDPLFPYFSDRADSAEKPAFRILGAEFVDTDEGTGIVHMAPGFGEEDQQVCEENGIEIGRVVPVDDQGRFTSDVPDFEGLNVFDANPLIIRTLKDEGRVFLHETYDHNYPHCWRTDTPIIYKAISSWYVEVTKLRERLLELNQEINWIPAHVQEGRFGQWLDNVQDWSVSRNRFWGSPIPIWKSDDPRYPRVDVYGSLDEIEEDFGKRPENLHRPFVDELTRPNPDDPTGNSTMRRVSEVLDCWFDSGSMPFAQVHYPFENKEWFENHFPADFVVEYINQTRGWFYTLHVLGTALFDKPAYRNVICHGILLAEDGAKLSKKLRNYTEPDEIFEEQGADALRWYFMSNNVVQGGDTRISDRAINEIVRQVLLPVWNTYYFLVLYANAEGYTATVSTDSEHVLDRYILAKTRSLVESVTARFDEYDLSGGADEIESFLDALTNWYVRRSRHRFWGTETVKEDTEAAIDTLYTVLHVFIRVVAPMLPMISEEIWTGLTPRSSVPEEEAPESVHLQDWPDPTELPADESLVTAMDRLRQAASAALSLRERQDLRVRLPLSSATVAGVGASSIEPFAELLADEINVKHIEFSDDVSAYGSFRLKPNGEVLGPKLREDMKAVLEAARSGDWEANDDGSVTVAGYTLSDDEFTLDLVPLDDVVAAPLPGDNAVIALDTNTTPELEAEGLARDLVRLIQRERKEADLDVTDRISLALGLPEQLKERLAPHFDWIKSQVLATELVIDSDSPTNQEIADESVHVSVSKQAGLS